MSRRTIAGMLALGAAALGLTGCAPQATAELTVTYTEGGEQVTETLSFTDLSCTTSSSLRVISSATRNDAGKEVFLATAPTDDRTTHTVSVWFDGRWFMSSAAFDASGSEIVFDALSGTVSESPGGDYPRTPGAEATLDGTVACG